MQHEQRWTLNDGESRRYKELQRTLGDAQMRRSANPQQARVRTVEQLSQPAKRKSLPGSCLLCVGVGQCFEDAGSPSGHDGSMTMARSPKRARIALDDRDLEARSGHPTGHAPPLAAVRRTESEIRPTAPLLASRSSGAFPSEACRTTGQSRHCMRGRANRRIAREGGQARRGTAGSRDTAGMCTRQAEAQRTRGRRAANAISSLPASNDPFLPSVPLQRFQPPPRPRC